MTSEELSLQDRRLLDAVQNDFPLVAEPYAVIGARLGLPEPQVRARLLEFRESGLLRRLGAVLDSRRLGYKSTLVAVSVPPERVPEVAAYLNALPGVTHNYLREPGDFPYNLWFTLTVEPSESLEGAIAEIARQTGIDDVLLLPATRLFKIKVAFRLHGGADGDGAIQEEHSAAVEPEKAAVDPDTPATLGVADWDLVRALSEDLAIVPRPFESLARQVGQTEDEVLTRLATFRESGVIRRFGATLKHYAVGFSANAMVVWRVPSDQVEAAGRVFAACDAVSHCYERPTFPSWPYNLYTMIHCTSRAECERTAAGLASSAGLSDYKLLFTERELKKERMRYGR